MYQGDQYFENWLEVVRGLLPGDTTIGYNIMKTNDILDQLVQPGEEVILFEVPWSEASRQLEQKIKNLEFSICYASLLNEYWIIDKTGNRQISSPCK